MTTSYRLEKATEELVREQARTTRAIEKLGENLKSQTLKSRPNYSPGSNTLAEEIPTDIEGVTPYIYGLSSFSKTPEGRIELRVVVSGGDADILEDLINREFFEKLMISSIAP